MLKSVGEPLTRKAASKQASDFKTKVAKALPDLPFKTHKVEMPD